MFFIPFQLSAITSRFSSVERMMDSHIEICIIQLQDDNVAPGLQAFSFPGRRKWAFCIGFWWNGPGR